MILLDVIPLRPAAAAATLGVLLLAACGGSTATTQPTAKPTLPPVQACAASQLPQAGFVPDPAHSGPLSVAKYSPSGDIQAALVYFHFENGVRQVFTDLPATASPGAAAGAAGPVSPHDVLVVCDAIEFRDADGARGFVGSFRQFRLDNKQTESSPPAIADRQVGFIDHDQSFSGYPIQHAEGAEIATAKGTRFYSVSVFGTSPTLQTAAAILRAVLGAGQ